MKTEIIIENLSKNFNEVRALKNVSLHIEKGMFGLIGRNGAGKTTLMRILATLLNKSGGAVTVCSVPAENPKEIRKLIGYLPQDFSVYPTMRVYEAMDYLGVLSGLSKSVRKERINELLNKVNLNSSRRLKVKALSGGMKRRLGIAQALLHDPQVLLLDEPASGLDPRARIEMRELLKRLGTRGKTIMVSSHILPELADVCNKVGIIERGELLVDADVSEVMRRVRDHILINIEIIGNVENAAKLLEQHNSVQKINITTALDGKQTIQAALKKGDRLDDYCDLPTILIENGYKIRSFKEDEVNLETAFMTLTKGITM